VNGSLAAMGLPVKVWMGGGARTGMIPHRGYHT
jgi:hypothetical protein